MKRIYLALAALAALFASCSSIDEYNYGYAPAYRTLPAGFEEVEIGGTTYWQHGGRYYRNDAERGYLLVKPPQGHTQVVSTGAGATPQPTGAVTPATGATPQATGTAPPAKKRSWLAPGGGTTVERGRPRMMGRSPIRHRRPATAE